MKRKRTMVISMIILTFILMLLSLSIGNYVVPLKEIVRILVNHFYKLENTWTSQMYNVVMNVRLPRIFANVLVGGALALSGACYQGLFKNPLVSPDILGVSSGACFGAAVGIVMYLESYKIQILASMGGFLAVLFAMFIPRMFKNRSTLMLVLSGVIVSGFMSSLLGLMKYISDPDDQLASIVFWTMGSFASIQLDTVIKISMPIIVCSSILILFRWRFNILSLGDKEAQSLGINVKRLRVIIIITTTIITAFSVSISGTIGWVGLIVPHLARVIIGQDNRYVIPASFFLGSSFILVIDTLARTLSHVEIPIGILTGAIGTPLFIILMFKQQYKIR